MTLSNFIKSFLKKRTHGSNQLLKNIAYLFVHHGANYVLPLITLPYLVRVLGPEKFGLLAFAQSMMQYFVILTDYGFNLSATRQIARHRNNPHQIASIFSTVMLIKIGLMVFSFILLSAIISLFPLFKLNGRLYYVMFFMVLGNVMFPTWFFLGLEKMKYITNFIVISRIITTLLIFLCVKQETDYLIAALIQTSGPIIACVLCVMVIPKAYLMQLIIPKRQDIALSMKEGWHVFVSTATTSLYTAGNAFILGLLTNNTLVGYYSGAEKIARSVIGVFSPISQAIYPHVNALAVVSKEKTLQFLHNLARITGLISVFLSLILFIFADRMVLLLLGSNYHESIGLLRWLAILPFIVSMSNVLGVQTMLTFGLNKSFSNIVISAGLLHIIFIVPLILKFHVAGAAISYVMTETYITTLMLITLYRHGYNLIHKINIES